MRTATENGRLKKIEDKPYGWLGGMGRPPFPLRPRVKHSNDITALYRAAPSPQKASV